MSNSIKTAIALSLAMAVSVSCVLNDRTLGEQFISDDYVLKVDSTSFYFPVKLRFRDTSQSVSTSRMMVGWLSDPLYGTVVAGGASHLFPLTDSANFGTNPLVKRVYMKLSVDSLMFFREGEEAIPQSITLYEIIKDVSDKVCNYSITPDCIASEPLNVGNPMIFGASTLTIGLKKEYGEKLLTMTQEECSTDSLFQQRFFGIYVQPEVTDREIAAGGGRLNFMNLYTSTIVVEYVLNDKSRGFENKDTTVSFLFGYAQALNQFTTGSKGLASEDPGEVLYVDGLSGVKPVISAVELKKRIDQWVDRLVVERGCDKESILLSQAKLILPYDMPEDFELFEKEHPASLYPFVRTDCDVDTSAYLEPLDAILNSGGGSIDRSHQYYYAIVTSDVQKMITSSPSEYDESDDWWICPVATIINSTTSSVTYDMCVDDYKRVILNGSTSDRAPKLELVYAVLNDW